MPTAPGITQFCGQTGSIRVMPKSPQMGCGVYHSGGIEVMNRLTLVLFAVDSGLPCPQSEIWLYTIKGKI